jgi:hypothetical protein
MERAFALARSGRYVNLAQVKARLNAEGYWSDAVTGPQLRSQLKVLIEAARTDGAPSGIAAG